MFHNDYGRAIASTLAGLGTLAILVLLLGTILLLVFCLIGRIKLFKKAGLEGWKAIIPFYSDYVFYNTICGLHWAWAAASIITSVVSLEAFVVRIVTLLVNAFGFYNLAIKCHKDKTATMVFGALFPTITIMVYGMSKNTTYYPYEEVKQSGLF